MRNEDYDTRSPRLFVENNLKENITLLLDDKQAHYLKNVLRRPDGSKLRVFNGKDGEYLANFTVKDKKTCVLNIEHQTRPQNTSSKEFHLVFSPIKKDRMDFMIEKSVELGVTHLHPILTRHTSVRDLNEDRVIKQIQEAAEQCERLDLPKIFPLKKLEDCLKDWPDGVPLCAAIERENARFVGKLESKNKIGLLIGPEGGFSNEEKNDLLEHSKIIPVHLGENILRAETAAIFGLSILIAKSS